MKGDTKLPVDATSWLLTTPAPVATKPLTSVARPMMVEMSPEGSAAELADEMSHDSNAENKIEVEIPPRTRPQSRVGIEGTVIQRHARPYVMQKTRHSLRRPLWQS